MIFDRFFVKGTNVINWTDLIKYIPEIDELKKCEQNPKWHSEGNAYEHTMKCLSYAYSVIDEINGLKKQRLALMAVLLHDIGKGTTTFEKNGVWHAYGHEFEGEKIARRILWDEPLSVREVVCSCIRYHMDVFRIFDKKHPLEEMYNLAEEVKIIDILAFVKKCDVYGSEPADKSQKENDIIKINYICKLADFVRNHHIGTDIDVFCRGKKPWEKDERREVVLLIGLPGAGKDTLIKRAYDTDKYVSISRDEIRISLGFCGKDEKIVGTPEQEDKVTKVFNEKLIAAIKNGKTPIINNINLKKKYRDGYKAFLSENGFNNIKWTYHYVEAPTLDENIKRREGQIPESAFSIMINNFDWPRHEEYDTFISYGGKR